MLCICKRSFYHYFYYMIHKPHTYLIDSFIDPLMNISLRMELNWTRVNRCIVLIKKTCQLPEVIPPKTRLSVHIVTGRSFDVFRRCEWSKSFVGLPWQADCVYFFGLPLVLIWQVVVVCRSSLKECLRICCEVKGVSLRVFEWLSKVCFPRTMRFLLSPTQVM